MIVTSSPRILAMLTLTCVALFSSQSQADSPPPPAIYPGWQAVVSSDWNVKNPVVQNWRRMLTRWSDGKPCESEACTTKGWAEMVAQVKATGDLPAQVKLANALIDDPAQHPYIADITNWKQQDYWETPYEFLKKSGDAEDFAITKYFLLKAAGVPVAGMQIIAVRVKSQGNTGHAVLAVRLDQTRTVILDNRVASVLDAKLTKASITPLLGVNENDWWFYLDR